MSRAEAGVTICEACSSTRVRHRSRSQRWDFDVGRCGTCGLRAVIDPPPDTVEREFDADRGDWPEYIAAQRGDSDLRTVVLDRLRGLVGLRRDTGPQVFDVGAGSGDFVALARDRGFDAGGCDISARGIAAARERHGLEISPLPLGDQPPQSTDAITMWCVIAHLADPAVFLDEAHRMLRPGGVLFVRTPRWCSFDRVGLIAARLRPAKLGRFAYGRVTRAHLRLYTEQAMRAQLVAAGFVDIEVQAASHYPFSSKFYLDISSTKGRLIGRAARVLDALIERNLFFRNTVFAYARRPDQP